MASLRNRFLVGAALIIMAMPSAVHADTAGQSTTFHIDPLYDSSGATTATATLRALGVHSYLYVDDRAWAALPAFQQVAFQNQLNGLVTAFDTTIWPNATAFWGMPAEPTGDPHITILIEPLISGAGGYFRSIDSYTPAQAPSSNNRPMLYVAAVSILGGTSQYFLAHEFQHLISLNQKEILQHVTDDVWLNEARSEYDISVVGYNTPYTGSTLERRVQAFLQTPSDSLVDWPNTPTDYAIATVFTQYLADRFGAAALQSTIHDKNAGVAAIDDWLTASNVGERFGNVFADWMVAASLNNRTDGAAFGYSSPGLSAIHVATPNVASVASNGTTAASFQVKEWQPVWYELDPSPTDTSSPNLTVAVNGQSSTFWNGSYVAFYGPTHAIGAWSATNGQATLAIPMQSSGNRLRSVLFTLTQGVDRAVGSRTISALPVTVSATLGTGAMTTTITTGGTASASAEPAYVTVVDGDLIRRAGQAEVYVVEGAYRRLLTPDILTLYGFQNRTVTTVPDDVFFRYRSSNYIRAQGDKKVYAIWPDNTKHWLNISAVQWTASGRDWGAIFTVNASEGAFYGTGPDITQ